MLSVVERKRYCEVLIGIINLSTQEKKYSGRYNE